MADFLTYRFPGASSVEMAGSLVAIDGIEEFNGFVMSNFEGNAFVGFVPSTELEKTILSSKKTPFVIDKESYLAQAEKYIAHFKSSKLQKAILSRVKKVTTQLSPLNFYNELTLKYPNAFCYLIQSAEFGTWVGACPEQLMKWENGEGSTISLAGTKATTDTSSWGQKELEEQALVTNFIAQTLKANTVSVEIGQQTEHIAGPVKHLVTHFNFKCAAENRTKIIHSLHPTPAVSGFPVKEALTLIAATEEHQREFYAGIIGVVSPSNCNLYVNLRCCQLIENDAFLYIGGGLTKDSVPEDEWNETENKALTLLNVLQNK